MYWSEKDDSKVYMTFCMQKVCREYWRGSGAGRKVILVTG